MTPEKETIKAFKESEFPINPPLPDDFDVTPNDDRPEWQIDYLWDRPFIRVTEYFGKADDEEYKASWFESWPEGKRYDVRCLDGGAWDRSTNWGMFGSLEEAIECCKRGLKPNGTKTYAKRLQAFFLVGLAVEVYRS